MIPAILKLKVKEEGSKGINLWLPLFIVWPFLLVFYFIGAILLLIPVLIVPRLKDIFILYLHMPTLIAALKGSEIDIQDSDNKKIFMAIS